MENKQTAAPATAVPMAGKPCGYNGGTCTRRSCLAGHQCQAMLLSAAPAVPLTARELQLINGMIDVQLHHAAVCDTLGNRTMAERQKGWDMERVELLRKLRGIGGGGK